MAPVKGEYVQVVLVEELTSIMLLMTCRGAVLFCCNPLGGCNKMAPFKGEFVQVVSVEEVTINRTLIRCKGAVLLCCNPLVGGCNKVAPLKGECRRISFSDVDVNTNVHGVWMEKGASNISFRVLGFSLYRRW